MGANTLYTAWQLACKLGRDHADNVINYIFIRKTSQKKMNIQRPSNCFIGQGIGPRYPVGGYFLLNLRLKINC